MLVRGGLLALCLVLIRPEGSIAEGLSNKPIVTNCVRGMGAVCEPWASAWKKAYYWLTTD